MKKVYSTNWLWMKLILGSWFFFLLLVFNSRLANAGARSAFVVFTTIAFLMFVAINAKKGYDRYTAAVGVWWVVSLCFGAAGPLYQIPLFVAAIGPHLVVRYRGGYEKWDMVTILVAGLPMILHFPIANQLSSFVDEPPYPTTYLLMVAVASWFVLVPATLVHPSRHRTRFMLSFTTALIASLLLFSLIPSDHHYQEWSYWRFWRNAWVYW